MATFEELGLSDLLIRAILNMGFEEATPIQDQTIPTAMEGRDLIGQAQTGTGKTAAYGIPMVERIMEQAEQIQGIVLAPTRELAVQVAEELNKIGQFKRIHALPIYGGQSALMQSKSLFWMKPMKCLTWVFWRISKLYLRKFQRNARPCSFLPPCPSRFKI